MPANVWSSATDSIVVRLRPPSSLYSPLNDAINVYGGGFVATVADVCLKALSHRDSHRALIDFGVRQEFVASDALMLLKMLSSSSSSSASAPSSSSSSVSSPAGNSNVSSLSSLKTSIAHMESIYRLLSSELKWNGRHSTDIRQFFSNLENKPIWVPDYRYTTFTSANYHKELGDSDGGKSAIVPGRFYSTSKCVWADHSHIIDACVGRGDAFIGIAPRVLVRHYGTLRSFFCRSLCPQCYGAGFDARGMPGCPACSDDSISQGAERSLIRTSVSIAEHITIAERIAAAADSDPSKTTNTFEARRDDVLKLLGVLSFAVLSGRLGPALEEMLPYLFKGKLVWPTKRKTFVALSSVVLDDALELSRKLLQMDAAAKFENSSTSASFNDVVDILDIPTVHTNSSTTQLPVVDLSQLGVEREFESDYLFGRLQAMNHMGVPISMFGNSDSVYFHTAMMHGTLPMGTAAIFEECYKCFAVLTLSVGPLIGSLRMRRMTDILKQNVFPLNTSYERQPVHDSITSALKRAQRVLRSICREQYDRDGQNLWRREVESLRMCCCNELEVVYSLTTLEFGEMTLRVPTPAYYRDNILYVARTTAEEKDVDPIFTCITSIFIDGRDDALTTKLCDQLLLCNQLHDDTSVDVFFKRCGIELLPDDEPRWVTLALDAALVGVSRPVPPSLAITSSEDQSGDEEEETTDSIVQKPRMKKKERNKREGPQDDGACWPPTAPDMQWPPTDAATAAWPPPRASLPISTSSVEGEVHNSLLKEASPRVPSQALRDDGCAVELPPAKQQALSMQPSLDEQDDVDVHDVTSIKGQRIDSVSAPSYTESNPNYLPGLIDGLSDEFDTSSTAIAAIASRLIGELHSAYLANDRTKQSQALNALLELPSGPMDASLSQLVLPTLLRVAATTTTTPNAVPFNDNNSSNAAASASICIDDDGQGLMSTDQGRGKGDVGDQSRGTHSGSGNSRSSSSSEMIQSVYARAIARWGGPGTSKNSGNNDNGSSHSTGSVPNFSNAPFPPAGSKKHDDHGNWALHSAADSNDASSGFHRTEFDPNNLTRSTLGDFRVMDRQLEPSSVDDAAALATFERYLAEASYNSPHHSLASGGDPTIHQQRLGLAGEALAAKWLSGIARSPALLSKLLGIHMGDPSTTDNLKNHCTDSDQNSSTDNWIVEWNNESTESGLPYDVILHCRGLNRTIYIEVKTTTTLANASIDVSINHLDFARAHPNNYLILRVFVEEMEATTTSISTPIVAGDTSPSHGSITNTLSHPITSDHSQVKPGGDERIVTYRACRIVVINSVWEAIRTKAIQILLRF